jgi:outer membrane murein-binding lipoprotein Lpp
MKTRLNVLLATAGIATVLLTGCVSSKKYKSSQSALQQVRNDSARLAQQVASLNENVHSLEQKSTTLQRSLDSTSNNYATQQKSLDYYQDYFNKQQSTLSQVGEELKGALSQAGLTNEDIQQANNAIYVSLDENKVFKKNSTAITSNGKQALNSLAQVIKNRSDVNVVVSDGDSSAGQTTMTGNMPSSSGRDNATMKENRADNATADNPTSRHRTSHHGMTRRRSEARNATVSAKRNNETRSDHTRNDATVKANENAAAKTTSQNNGKSDVAVAHKRVHRKYSSSEGSMRIYSNGYNSSKNRSWALKQGRVNTVANSLLQNGVPKVNVLLQQPASNGSGQNNSIKVIITPAMSDFNPQKNSSAKVETK